MEDVLVETTIEVKKVRLAEFEREFHQLFHDVAEGRYDAELRARGIVLPSSIPEDAISTESVGEQHVAADQFVVLAIKYSPLIVSIGLDLWKWAWPKLRERSDGAARDR
jgi:hypothetical protein